MINQENILFTGGSGLLGKEIKKLIPDAIYPSSTEFNIENYEQIENYIKDREIKIIVHAAAFTSPPKVDNNPIKGIDTNIIGTSNIVKLCSKYNIKVFYISTDYVFSGDKGNYKEDDSVNPVNKYAWSKLGGECAVRLYDNSLIIRTSFGPKEFPYDKAFVDQYTTREPVNIIADKIVKLINSDIKGIIHIGGNKKTVFEYANKLSPEKGIKELHTKDVNFKVPKDTSLNCEKYNKFFGGE